MKLAMVLGLTVLAMAGCGERKADNDGGEVVELAQPADYTAEEKAALLAAMPAPYNAADLADGEKQFGKCRACHTITADKMNLTGPYLYGVFGRKAGAEADYTYSEAMTTHGVTWDYASLDTFIETPQTVVKGTRMAYAGIKNPDQRRNLIAYLKLQTTPRPASGTAASQ